MSTFSVLPSFLYTFRSVLLFSPFSFPLFRIHIFLNFKSPIGYSISTFFSFLFRVLIFPNYRPHVHYLPLFLHIIPYFISSLFFLSSPYPFQLKPHEPPVHNNASFPYAIPFLSLLFSYLPPLFPLTASSPSPRRVFTAALDFTYS